MAYDKNLELLLTGHLGLPDTPTVQQGSKATTGPIEDSLDIRDVLSGVIGKGYTDFSTPDAKHYFAYLSTKVGRKAAQDLFTHAFLFNQRDDIKGKSTDEKLEHFYSTRSNNPDVDNIVQGVGHYRGSDPVAAARRSSDVGNMQATGRNISGTSSGASDKEIKDIADKTIKTS